MLRFSGIPAIHQSDDPAIGVTDIPEFRAEGIPDIRSAGFGLRPGLGVGYSCIAPTTPIAEPIGAPPALRQHDTDRRRAPNETGADALRRAWPISWFPTVAERRSSCCLHPDAEAEGRAALHLALLERLQGAGQINWRRSTLDSASVPAKGGEGRRLARTRPFAASLWSRTPVAPRVALA